MRAWLVTLLCAAAPARAERIIDYQSELVGNEPDPPGYMVSATAWLAGTPTVLGGDLGVTGLRGRLFWDARAHVRSPFGSEDYGPGDWDVSDGGPHLGATGHLGLAVWARAEQFPIVVDGAMRVSSDGVDRYERYYLGRRSSHVILLAGTEAGFIGDFVLAVPIAIRYQRRTLISTELDGDVRESWYQIGARLFPLSPAFGLSAKALLPWLPVYVFAEWMPALGDDELEPQCSIAGRPCEPPYDANYFDVVPGRSQLLVGAGVRLSWAAGR